METADTAFANLISAAVAAKLTPEFIEKEVHSRVGKLIVDAVDVALRSYSETGKMIHGAVEAALQVNSIDLPSYGSVVTAMVKAQVEANVAEIVSGKLSEDVEHMLKLAPKTVKLSKIAEELIEGRHSGVDYGPAITLIVEHSRTEGYVHIYIDDERVLEERDKYRCKYQLGIGPDGKIYSAQIGERDINAGQHLGGRHSFAQKVRAYYAVGTVIELDEDYVTTTVGDY